jgi:GntR family transcriptional regulator / MocR family aminotransferase
MRLRRRLHWRYAANPASQDPQSDATSHYRAVVEFHVSLVGRTRLSEQIYRQIRDGIRGGVLRPDDVLPSSRELADRLNVSRNTVTAAYDRLGADGLIEARPGVGAYIRNAADAAETATAEPTDRPSPAAAPQPLPIWDTLPPPRDLSATEHQFDFRGGIPSMRHFPYNTWRSLVSRQLRASATTSAAYSEPAGSSALRAAVARHIAVARGVHATAEDVFITSGIQQALDLIARVILAPGDIVAVEDPGYPPATMLFQSLRMDVVGVPVDEEGLVVSAIPNGTRLVYVTPSHQFPLGMSMTLGRRRQLLEWADRTGAVIVEDDYDSEFRLAGRPLETLQSVDKSWRVLYVGSFSKTMLPALRLGFVVAPPTLFPALRKAKFVTDWHTAIPMQDALAQFIDDGHFARHIRRMRRIYEDRHHLTVSILETDFRDVLELVPSAAGIHVAALFRQAVAVGDVEIMRRARQRGVGLDSPISRFATTLAPRHGLVFGYGAIPTERIREGLQRLHQCFLDS